MRPRGDCLADGCAGGAFHGWSNATACVPIPRTSGPQEMMCMHPNVNLQAIEVASPKLPELDRLTAFIKIAWVPASGSHTLLLRLNMDPLYHASLAGPLFALILSSAASQPFLLLCFLVLRSECHLRAGTLLSTFCFATHADFSACCGSA